MKLEGIKLPAKFKGSDEWWGEGAEPVIDRHTDGLLKSASGLYFLSQKALDSGLVTLIEEDLNNPNKNIKSQWFGKKYRVTPETSKLLQEEVFKAGGRWACGTGSVQLVDMPFLFLDDDGAINTDGCEHWFNTVDKPEGVLELNLVLKDVIDPPPETVEINGKQYLKSDIDNLRPVK